MEGGRENWTAVVTGSSTGLGKGIAERFGELGMNVVTNSRSEDRARAAAEEIRENGGTAVGVEADTSDHDAVQRLVDTAVEEFGSVDVMVNNAGTTVEKPLLEQEPEEWQHVIDVNLTGVFFGAQAAARRMAEQDDGGRIVNMSSIWGSAGVQGRAPYNASKGAVENLTRCLAVEFSEHDIQVNALAPGYIETRLAQAPWGESADEQPDWPYIGYSDEHIRQRTPLGRYGTLEEVQNCTEFLATADHYMTGETLHADGGWLAFGWGSKGE